LLAQISDHTEKKSQRGRSDNQIKDEGTHCIISMYAAANYLLNSRENQEMLQKRNVAKIVFHTIHFSKPRKKVLTIVTNLQQIVKQAIFMS
jgi:hypothetical protein